MIDSHSHTKYSKHAIGNVEDLVISAINKNIKILTITDHAPFYVDKKNRLLTTELQSYFDDIEYVKEKYSKYIKILKGLEIDFLPNSTNFTENLICNLDLDYVIGSIHYIFIDSKRINMWDLKYLNNSTVLEKYFLSLKELFESKLFNAVGHPDSVLRAGIKEDVYYNHFLPLIPLMKHNKISYELNASGLSKTTYDANKDTELNGIWSYPSKMLVSTLNVENVSFTIGSDTHSPENVGRGIQNMLTELENVNLKSISYYEKRKRVDIPLSNLSFVVDSNFKA